MLLAVDVGNTNVVFAVLDGLEIVRRWRISTKHDRTADEYAVQLHQLMALDGIDRASVDAVIVASVVPQTLFNLRGLARRAFDVEPMLVGADGVELGIRIDLPNPTEVGADRLVNAVAAHADYPGDLIVVDFGTATTFDVVDGDGSYKGGVIAPGANLSTAALTAAAAKLPRIAVEPPREGLGVIGTGTVHAMQSGVFWGYVGLVEGLVARIKSEVGRPMTVIGTGGLATIFIRHTAAIDVVDADLTIRGLARIHALNARPSKDTEPHDTRR